ncbi:hypothetical protein RV134_260409 [Roseovarius sp. EC-HK134]|nr:hypothetical protein RV134_260409 [Roseovarius sp. EC-HK134]VVT11566.1 hypothetical protein RV420_290624 [Roseovarius sp. EC-SD190]
MSGTLAACAWASPALSARVAMDDSRCFIWFLPFENPFDLSDLPSPDRAVILDFFKLTQRALPFARPLRIPFTLHSHMQTLSQFLGGTRVCCLKFLRPKS